MFQTSRKKEKTRRMLQLTKLSKPDRAVKRLRNPIRKGLIHSNRIKETYIYIYRNRFSRNRQQLETVEKYLCTAQLGEFLESLEESSHNGPFLSP